MTKPKVTELAEVSCRGGLYQTLAAWTQEIIQHLPELRGPQARVLALWSLGMVLAQACGLSAVAL